MEVTYFRTKLVPLWLNYIWIIKVVLVRYMVE